MEETLKYLTKRVIDLESDKKQILNSNFGLRQEIKELEHIKEIIKYIYNELKSYDYFVPDEAKEELLKYLDENVGFDLYE